MVCFSVHTHRFTATPTLTLMPNLLRSTRTSMASQARSMGVSTNRTIPEAELTRKRSYAYVWRPLVASSTSFSGRRSSPHLPSSPWWRPTVYTDVTSWSGSSHIRAPIGRARGRAVALAANSKLINPFFALWTLGLSIPLLGPGHFLIFSDRYHIMASSAKLPGTRT